MASDKNIEFQNHENRASTSILHKSTEFRIPVSGNHHHHHCVVKLKAYVLYIICYIAYTYYYAYTKHIIQQTCEPTTT